MLCYLDKDEPGTEPHESSPSSSSRDSSEPAWVERTCFLVEPEQFASLMAWFFTALILNVVLGLVSWWRCYANHFLHWGALATWLLLLVQGCVFYGLRAQQSRLQLYGDIVVWYNMFILFVMYCMLPVPVKWCTLCCLLTALVHLVLMAAITSSESSEPQPKVRPYIFTGA